MKYYYVIVIVKRQVIQRAYDVENSFFTPWNFDPNAVSGQTFNARRYVSFQPGSFFTHQPKSMEPPDQDRSLMVHNEGTTLAQVGAVSEPDQVQTLMVKKEGTTLAQVGAVSKRDQDRSSSKQEESICLTKQCVIG
ncbi:hypothetical protein L1987_82413 [Smallanthus sonchifolius]|uniref:Uncharacterized protein n=1 Tax=Smallanthus sonchifolius TaxID=185202 RepID=A0ACB8YB41_9ASTR|nr:hypothetical protein L1987_82413 [Smallanthus sonchifolius]